MIPCTATRVVLNTHEKLNEQVLQRIREKVVTCAQSHPQAIEKRLTELDQEWDTDRLMETTAALTMLVGIGLAAAFSPWWMLLAAVAGVCLLSHGLFGWDPLLPMYRGWGVRTSLEIDYERYTLKVLRGDFQNLSHFATPDDRDAITRMEGEGGPVQECPHARNAADHVVVEEALAAASK